MATKQEKIQYFFEVTGAKILRGKMLDGILQVGGLMSGLSVTHAEEWAEFCERVKNEVEDRAADVFDKYYEEADMDNMTAFAESATGKKTLGNSGKISQELTSITREVFEKELLKWEAKFEGERGRMSLAPVGSKTRFLS